MLLENAGFVYAFGNTPAASLYRRESRLATLRLLLLGFGDVRHALATAAGCAADATSACRALRFELNDVSPLNVARGILLLHLVRLRGRGTPTGAVTCRCSLLSAPRLPGSAACARRSSSRSPCRRTQSTQIAPLTCPA